jgi:hypothetical protein
MLKKLQNKTKNNSKELKKKKKRKKRKGPLPCSPGQQCSLVYHGNPVKGLSMILSVPMTNVFTSNLVEATVILAPPVQLQTGRLAAACT